MKTNNNLEEIMKYHLQKYPEMELSDMVKLIYQNEWGGGHLIEDANRSLLYIQEEMRQSQLDIHSEFSEDIGNGVSRIYLSAFRQLFSDEILALHILNQLFVTGATFAKGNLLSFKEKLQIFQNLCKTNFFLEKNPNQHWAEQQMQLSKFLQSYADEGYPMMRHSQHYREEYKPAYRIVSNGFASYIPLFQKIETLLQNKERVVIGIDGRCGSGKTTLADILHNVFDCSLIRMDDFFLPPNLRTAERLNQAGANVHHERFQDEVLRPLKESIDFSYRTFDCSIMNYADEPKKVEIKPLTIIEGSYSMRPEFLECYDLKIFMDIADDFQKERIINRNGAERYKMFEQKWIPMENKYFESFQVKQTCDEIFFAHKTL